MTNIRGITDPDSATFYELSRSLREVSAAARSLRLLSNYVERNPRALIFGKPEMREGTMKRWIKSVMKVGLIGLSLAACGTFSPRPDPSRFFTLSSLPQVEQGSLRNSTRPEKMFLGIGPIRFPGYLDRQEIVVRSAQNRFDVSENDRWAEPLQENFSRVLVGKSCAAPEHGSDYNLPVVAHQSAALSSRDRCAASRG